MTERDYIIAGDLAKCRIVQTALRDIVPLDENEIPPDEHQRVMRLIAGWIGRLEQLVEDESEETR